MVTEALLLNSWVGTDFQFY